MPLERLSGRSTREVETIARTGAGWLEGSPPVDECDVAVEISPSDIVRRRRVSWDGMAAEIVQATRRDRIDARFRAPVHMLVLGERGARSEGETFVRDYHRKLTFVLAGHDYYDWQLPNTLTRVVY